MINESIVGQLKKAALEGKSPSAVATWLRAELGEACTQTLLMRYFRQAFEIPLITVRELELWEGLDQGGTLTNAELDEMLGDLKVRR